MNDLKGTKAEARASVGLLGCGGGGGGLGHGRQQWEQRNGHIGDLLGERQRPEKRAFLNAAPQHSYPDRLGDALHDFPAEEAWVSLALLLSPKDHVPPIGLLVGASVQESLEVQSMLLPKAHHVCAPAPQPQWPFLKQRGHPFSPALPQDHARTNKVSAKTEACKGTGPGTRKFQTWTEERSRDNFSTYFTVQCGCVFVFATVLPSQLLLS